jgi:ATP-binding cassette subfamily B protein
MEHKWRKLFGYYKPYKIWLFSDLFFALLGATVTLVIPLIVRYITNKVVYMTVEESAQIIIKLGIAMLGLVLLEAFCNFFIAYYGHVMGAKIEYDMRNEIFSHYQKLSFTFYDNQKVGQLMSRVTNDLFEISELLHHGPEDVIISVIKFVGSFLILISINTRLTIIAFAFLPIMFLYAFYFNKKMKKAFK